MLKVCWAGIPLRRLKKAASGNTVPLLKTGVLEHLIHKGQYVPDERNLKI